jgi:hypothetical protein
VGQAFRPARAARGQGEQVAEKASDVKSELRSENLEGKNVQRLLPF